MLQLFRKDNEAIMKTNRLFSLIAVTLFVSVISTAQASNVTPVGKYLSVVNQPTHAQVDLLSQTIQVHFPQDIKTVGDAINHLLQFSGYSLVSVNKMNPALLNTLSKPLPVVDRDLGPVSLRQALIVLAGPAFSLSRDPINREVNFTLNKSFSKRSRA